MCDVCGFQFKLKQLKVWLLRTENTQHKSVSRVLESSQPQLKLGEFPVNDPQAIRNPRPDRSLRRIREFIVVEIYSGVGTL